MRLNIDALQELYDTLTYGPVLSSPYAESPIDRAFKKCDEKLSGSATFAHIKSLEDRCNNLERSNKALRTDNDKLGDKVIELNKKKEQLEKDLDVCNCSNKMLLAGSMESISEKRKLENEIKDLKKACDAKSKENATLISANADLSDRNAHLQRNFERVDHLWTIQIQESMELRSKIANLKKEKEVYETIAKEREDLVKERDGWRSRALEAEKRVWDLVNVNDNLTKKIAELQKKGDDLTKKGEDLKKLINSVYGTTTRRLADALRKNGMYETYSERLGCFMDVCDIEDLVEWDLEDFLDEYEKWVKKRIMPENPNFYFDNKPITMEAKVEVNKDLLAKVCGVEHQLEYGDAVRVPWKSYDYMYIGPEGKHIRLFDPKTHTVVLVSVKDNLTYQGCKIILCDEDDIRKI